MRVRYWDKTIFLIATFMGLYWISSANYLLFHSLAEIFSIVIASCVFFLVWNAKGYLKNNYWVFLGTACLFVAVIDVIHMLSYGSMGVFQGYGANLSTQLWIAARYLQSISLLIAPFFIHRNLKPKVQIFCYLTTIALLLTAIFYWRIFPVCFVKGDGLTFFKIISEYIISLILVGAAFALWRNRSEFDQRTMRLLLGSIVATIIAELAFTFYIDVYGFSNMIGHFGKIIAFYFIYVAIIEIGLMKPYKLLFRELKIQQKELHFIQYALDNISDNVFWVGSDGEIKYANKSAQRKFGYTREETLLLNICAINPQCSPQIWEKNWSRLKKEGMILYEATFKTKSGKTFPAEVSANHMKFGEKEFNCLFIRNISSRKITETKLSSDIKKLEIFNETMINRETKIIELKEEINQLCADLGRESEYPPVWLEEPTDDDG